MFSDEGALWGVLSWQHFSVEDGLLISTAFGLNSAEVWKQIFNLTPAAPLPGSFLRLA